MNQLEFSVEPTGQATPKADIDQILADPGFGTHFTDHMVTIEWSEDQGWHDARVRAYAPFELDPATTVFHYGQAIFEGLKAYRQPDGSIAAFRPEANAERMRHSAQRLAMPELPDELFLEAIRQLVRIDQDWVPAAGGEESLYLRPFMIATEVALGVHPAKAFTFAVIASPAGAYFGGEVKPVSVWLCEDYVRAAPGGTGAAKFAGNYAASLLAQAQAAEKGCDQVVWLDAIEHKNIEEMGGMNLAFIYRDGEQLSLVTPKLSGSLLPGITRASLLQVAEDLGIKAIERTITTDQWQRDAESGAMVETFACGTAAVITPVGTVKSKHGEFQINGGKTGDITMQLRNALTDIQRGEAPDTHRWKRVLVEA